MTGASPDQPASSEVTEGAVPVPGAEPGETLAPPTPPVVSTPPGASAAVPPPSSGADPVIPPAGPAGSSAEAESAGGGPADAVASTFPPDRPERKVGAAFAGGLLLAIVLKRLAR